MLVGITGNSGTGQTTAAGMLGEMGADVCSLDHVGHLFLTRAQTRTLLAKAYCDPDLQDCSTHELRRRLGGKAFYDPMTMAVLEDILHPRMRRWVAMAASRLEDREGLYVLEGALILEMGLDWFLDRLVVVTDSPDRSMARIMKRDLIDKQLARARWDNQWELPDKIAAADYVIDNSGSLGGLRESVRVLYNDLVSS